MRGNMKERIKDFVEIYQKQIKKTDAQNPAVKNYSDWRSAYEK